MPAIYTRSGDRGQTGLFGGSRVDKDSARVEAYGTVDEANTLIGQAKALLPGGHPFRDDVHRAQLRLFVVGAELASDAAGRGKLADLVGTDDVSALERVIDRTLEITGPPTQFVVPGRDPRSATFHVARSAVRRAERRVLTLAHTDEVRPELVKYLNRLSDALYAIARVLEQEHDQAVVRDIVERNLREAGLPTGTGQKAAFTLETAMRMAEAVQAAAARMGLPVAFGAVDEHGTTMLLHRMPGTLLVSLDLALNKAWTAAALRQPTDRIKEQVLESGDLYGLQASNQGRVVAFGGGEPIFVAGRLAGGIGISGGTVEQDMALVKVAMASTGSGN
ncbi:MULTISPECIES: cob(I)yrinic acid a,c-diamide adenosyltransferase [unclassified Luteococcus]|uniref:cob(I)yrinic acid a,c-diamide adenosyltransferase n=1 Tax=unclassified Luteococcus TaxID=2639923 RepID=UPI00313EF978